MSDRKCIGIVGYGVVGKGMERLFEGQFDIAIYDPGEGYSDKEVLDECDLAIICVPTDINADIVEHVVSWIPTPLMLIKSTVPPGTTTMLREKYHKKINFSPEYMGESAYFTPYWKYPDPKRAETHTFVIVGGDEASEILNYFQQVMSVDTHYVVATPEEAELTKYMENAFFATKVAFCNEFYDLAQSLEVDYKRLRELWLLDSRINPNHTLVFPEKRGFGGKCLPKDLRKIAEVAKGRHVDTPVLDAVQQWAK